MFLCNYCHHSYTIKDASIISGCCRACFDGHYRICDCGEIISRHYTQCDNCQFGGGSMYPKPLTTSIATYHRIKSKRKFGVEFETSQCDGYEDYVGVFGVKEDGSIDGMEFDSPVLYGDEGIAEIEKFLDYAHAREWAVDRRCGTHIHLDMRNENLQQLIRIAYAYLATYSVWKSCVPRSRADNSYCHASQYGFQDLRHVSRQAEAAIIEWFARRPRYEWLNLFAYSCHNTFEVRLFNGTLNKTKIINWIRAHCLFMDAVKDLTFDAIDRLATDPWAFVKDKIRDAETINWLESRARGTVNV